MKDFHTHSDDRALKLVREVTDTDWCSTTGDTAVMCDLKRTTVQYIFKVGVQECIRSGSETFEYNT